MSYYIFTNWNIYEFYIKNKKFIYNNLKLNYQDEKILGIDSNSFSFQISRYSCLFSFSFENFDSHLETLILFIVGCEIGLFLLNEKI